jgi:hypothetical protein
MTSSAERHRHVRELLPWYVNGTLEEPEAEAVRAHLPGCEACREDVTRCRDLAVAVQSARAPEWAPSREHLARLLERIDAIEAGAGGGRWHRWLGSRAASVREAFRSAPAAMRWALAGQAALVAVLAAIAIWQATAGWNPGYRTLAGPSDPPRGGQARIRLVFAEDITEAEMRALLGRIEGSIVGGPSPAGAYTVAVPNASDQTAAVNALRASGKVRLAEPVPSR